jgi:hypothetical protein
VAFRKPIGDFFNWLGGAIMDGIKVIWKAGEPIRKFWSDAWENAKKLATDFIKWIGNAWQSIGKFFSDYVTTPISKGWDAMVQLLPKAMKNALDFVQNAWGSMVNGIKGAMRSVLQFIANNLNSIGAQVNRLIGAFNSLPGPDIPFVPTLSVPAFAKGGVVSGPTLAMVGEGGEPEYIIPERKMAQASMNYLNGARGGAVIPAYAQGGYIGGNAQINVTTGPVMQQGGQQYVSMADLEKAMRKTADGIYASLRTPAGRYAVGVR